MAITYNKHSSVVVIMNDNYEMKLNVNLLCDHYGHKAQAGWLDGWLASWMDG